MMISQPQHIAHFDEVFPRGLDVAALQDALAEQLVLAVLAEPPPLHHTCFGPV